MSALKMLREPGMEHFQGEEGQGLCWGRGDFACRSCVCRWGWSPLLHKRYFINIFISLLVLKLGVVELVLQSTGLGGAGCAVAARMLAWDAPIPERGWRGSSKTTVSSKISPLPPG